MPVAAIWSWWQSPWYTVRNCYFLIVYLMPEPMLTLIAITNNNKQSETPTPDNRAQSWAGDGGVWG